MGIDCGSQVVVCEYPVHFDTYRGCSHGCKYCFARARNNIETVEKANCITSLRRFIDGSRSANVLWCDWNIPLHWGSMSDPFQPAERDHHVSLEALKVFKETQYPFIVSTKGRLIIEEPYLSLLSDCNAVVQVSMVCPLYDKLEQGAPPFDERLRMVRTLSENCKRVVVRVQPYITNALQSLIESIPRIKEAGAYGITVEGMKFKRKKKGLVKVGGDFCYPEDRLKQDYEKIRKAAHDVGLAFFCAENRLRPMGDSFACCGCGDLDGFNGNPYNAVSIINGRDVHPTETMLREGTGSCFSAIPQGAGVHQIIKNIPFATHMQNVAASMR